MLKRLLIILPVWLVVMCVLMWLVVKNNNDLSWFLVAGGVFGLFALIGNWFIFWSRWK